MLAARLEQSTALADKRRRKPLAAVAHPTDPASRISDHQGVGRHVVNNHAARPDERRLAHGDPADHRGVGPDRSPTPHQRGGDAQARQPGSRRLLRPRTVRAGSFAWPVPFVPPRAVAERACSYLSEASASVPDATADTLMPLPIPAGERCRSLVFNRYRSSIAGIVVEGLTCPRASASLSRWRGRGFEPQSGPSGYTCAISKPDDVDRRAYECRRDGTAKLSFLVWRAQPGTKVDHSGRASARFRRLTSSQLEPNDGAVPSPFPSGRESGPALLRHPAGCGPAPPQGPGASAKVAQAVL